MFLTAMVAFQLTACNDKKQGTAIYAPRRRRGESTEVAPLARRPIQKALKAPGSPGPGYTEHPLHKHFTDAAYPAKRPETGNMESRAEIDIIIHIPKAENGALEHGQRQTTPNQ